MNDGGYLYELTCTVDPEHEGRYREVISDAVVQWFSTDGLAGFRPLSELGTETVRLQFEFTDQQTLDAFVNTECHRATIDTLRTVCTRIETRRWQPSAVSLEGGSANIVSRSDPPSLGEVTE